MKRYRSMAVALAMCVGSTVWAEGPAPFPEFSAKRIKPPTAPVGQRITIQIEPQAPAAVQAAQPAAASRAEGAYDWFWSDISPDASAAGPGRLSDALRALATASSPVPAPRLQDLQNIARANGKSILLSTINTEVSPALALAVIAVESAGKADAVSRAGAQGLMQLMPDTAARFGVSDSLAAEQNIRGGIAYLDWLMGHFDGDPILVLAGYNAGEGAVRSHDGVPPFRETRDYVPKVLAAFQVARGLCLTPPQLISDGCVFAGMD